MRANRGRELVIRGYVPASTNFDSILVGYYEGRDLRYAARIRSGFVPAMRQRVFAQFRGLQLEECPFVNLPERGRGKILVHGLRFVVGRGGIEPPTQGFSVLCSTD